MSSSRQSQPGTPAPVVLGVANPNAGHHVTRQRGRAAAAAAAAAASHAPSKRSASADCTSHSSSGPKRGKVPSPHRSADVDSGDDREGMSESPSDFEPDGSSDDDSDDMLGPYFKRMMNRASRRPPHRGAQPSTSRAPSVSSGRRGAAGTARPGAPCGYVPQPLSASAARQPGSSRTLSATRGGASGSTSSGASALQNTGPRGSRGGSAAGQRSASEARRTTGGANSCGSQGGSPRLAGVRPFSAATSAHTSETTGLRGSRAGYTPMQLSASSTRSNTGRSTSGAAGASSRLSGVRALSGPAAARRSSNDGVAASMRSGGGGGRRRDEESFTAIGPATSGSSARSSGDDVGGRLHITQATSAADVAEQLKILPNATLAALGGLLMAQVSPEMAAMFNVKGSESSTGRGRGGDGTARGLVANIMAPLAFAFIGSAKIQYSGGEPPSPATNAFLAAAQHIWPAVNGTTSFTAAFTKQVVSARSHLHGDVRNALAEMAINVLEAEDSVNKPFTITDLFRGARLRVSAVPAEDPAMEELLRAIFARFFKAHVAKNRDNLEFVDLLGAEKLLPDFASEVYNPCMLSAMLDMEHTRVVDIGSHETVVCLAGRKARAWAKLTNGGYTTRNARAFQDNLWYSIFNFVTGPRRVAHGLRGLARAEFSNPSIVRFVAPYADVAASGAGGGEGGGGAGGGGGAEDGDGSGSGGGNGDPDGVGDSAGEDESLVVEETAPPAGESDDDSWTESFLDELV